MDGDSVTDEPSQSSEETSLAETFTQLCPYYMQMGMSYHDFWNTNTKVHKAYREAYKMRRKDDEWDRWRRGAYTYVAILRLAPVLRASFGKGKVEPLDYLEQPMPLTQKEAEEREELARLQRYRKFKESLESQSKGGEKDVTHG